MTQSIGSRGPTPGAGTLLRGVAAACLAALAACQMSPPTVMLPGQAQTQRAPAFVLHAGTEIEVKFLDTPELDVVQAVRPDGCISLALLGDLAVAGRTLEELRHELEERYAVLLKEPEILVILRGIPFDHVVVAGQVATPGSLSLNGPLTALDAVLMTGGSLLEKANLAEVLVLRRFTDRYCGYRVDLMPALKGQAAPAFYLQAGDVVYVPRASRLEQLLGESP